ncbi:MAG: glycosyltransferase, partial [Lachnospiraceae bacterium]|nr:glycosyltransferase [Lachnospiraceae bacterium]
MQEQNSLISVIVPIYNAEKYLSKCLDCVVRQTYNNLEIILVNDGSVDQSQKICENYAKRDKRIQIIQKENEGVSAARNDGMKKSKGAYIAFIDADDVIFPEYIAYLFGLLQKYDADMSCCNFYKMWDTEKVPEFDDNETVKVFNAKEALEDFLYNKNITCHPFLKLYSRDLIEQVTFPEEINY